MIRPNDSCTLPLDEEMLLSCLLQLGGSDDIHDRQLRVRGDLVATVQ